MSTTEGAVLRKWRKSLGLTQEELAESCEPKASQPRIRDIEIRNNSASVATLLRVIHGLERAGNLKLGTTPEQKLAAFFQGPDATEARKLAAKRAREFADLVES